MFEDRPDRDAEVVLVGRSNVGKSTLMRELTGHDFSTGGKPGVTRQPNHFDWASESFMFTDLPGFGFMSGVEEEHREAIKTNIVRYRGERRLDSGGRRRDGRESRRRSSSTATPSAGTSPRRGDVRLLRGRGRRAHRRRQQDRQDRRPRRAARRICDRLGLYPPWQQWSDQIAPICAKRGDIEALEECLRTRFHEHNRDDLLKFVS